MDDAAITENSSHRLVSSRMVEGTAVFDPAGNKIGRVHAMMIDKASGQVAYAVLAFGGFLHMGEHVHPVPWKKLSYSHEHGGYVTDITRETLDAAPMRTLDAADRPHTPSDEELLYRFYGIGPGALM